jgi:hypothetical protein
VVRRTCAPNLCLFSSIRRRTRLSRFVLLLVVLIYNRNRRRRRRIVYACVLNVRQVGVVIRFVRLCLSLSSTSAYSMWSIVDTYRVYSTIIELIRWKYMSLLKHVYTLTCLLSSSCRVTYSPSVTLAMFLFLSLSLSLSLFLCPFLFVSYVVTSILS